MTVRIAMVAGETSGDLLASHLIRALRQRIPDAEFFGIGGPKMQAEGFDARWSSELLAVHGYVRDGGFYRAVPSGEDAGEVNLVLVAREDERAEDDAASEEEVEAFIEVGTQEGILEPGDRDLVWGVVDFGDTQARSVMTPRVDMVCGRIGDSFERLAEIFT